MRGKDAARRVGSAVRVRGAAEMRARGGTRVGLPRPMGTADVSRPPPSLRTKCHPRSGKLHQRIRSSARTPATSGYGWRKKSGGRRVAADGAWWCVRKACAVTQAALVAVTRGRVGTVCVGRNGVTSRRALPNGVDKQYERANRAVLWRAGNVVESARAVLSRATNTPREKGVTYQYQDLGPVIHTVFANRR